MSDHHKAHPEYGAMGVFAGYGEFDEEKPMTQANADDLVERQVAEAICCPKGCVRRDDCFVGHKQFTTSQRDRELVKAVMAIVAPLRSLLAAAEARNEMARKALENTQGAVHLLRKAIHAADPRTELDLRCHDIWTEIETALRRSQSSGGGK